MVLLLLLWPSELVALLLVPPPPPPPPLPPSDSATPPASAEAVAGAEGRVSRGGQRDANPPASPTDAGPLNCPFRSSIDDGRGLSRGEEPNGGDPPPTGDNSSPQRALPLACSRRR